MQNIHLLTQDQRLALAYPRPAILPVGWTVNNFTSTVDVLDHNGRLIHSVAKPYASGTMGELLVRAMNEIKAGKSIVPVKFY